MNERTIIIPLPTIYPGASAALGDAFAEYTVFTDMTIVAVTAAPAVDDTGLTLDINNSGGDDILALSCADADVPGTWKSTAVGGTNTPVRVPAGSALIFDANNAANGTSIVGYIQALIGEYSS